MATRRNYSPYQKAALRKVPLLTVLQELGFDTSVSSRSTNDFFIRSPFRDEKDPSFHITHRITGDVWFDQGGSAKHGGDVYSLVKEILSERGLIPSSGADAETAVWDYLARFNPSIVPEEVAETEHQGPRGGRRVTLRKTEARSAEERAPAPNPLSFLDEDPGDGFRDVEAAITSAEDNVYEEATQKLSTILHSVVGGEAGTQQAAPSGIVCHTGGAVGSDTAWSSLASSILGAEIRAYYYKEKTPGVKSNPGWGVEITSEQYDDGIKAAVAANRILGRRPVEEMPPYMRNLIARNWQQVANADAVYAVGKIVSNGRGSFVVDGGTGWAVQEAINSRKPVYVLNQKDHEWYTVDYESGKWRRLAIHPRLVPNFAGVGSREIGPYEMAEMERVVRTLSPEKAVETKVIRTENIFFSSGENRELSNMAPCRFVLGEQQYESCEQAFHHIKALYFGDSETAKAILATEDAYAIRRLGKQVMGYDDAKWSGVRDLVMYRIVSESVMSSLSKAKALLATGDSVLTHTARGFREDHWSVAFPAILMQVRKEIRSRFPLEENFFVSEKEDGEKNAITVRKECAGFRCWQNGGYAKDSDEQREQRLVKKIKDFYVTVKKIPAKILDKYGHCVTCVIGDSDKESYAAGNPTVSGGWNLRWPDYNQRDKEGREVVDKDGNKIVMPGKKRFAGASDITVIDKDGNYVKRNEVAGIGADKDDGVYYELPSSSENVIVFEGFTDFLAWQSTMRRDRPGMDVVILNSVSNTQKAQLFVAAHRQVILCMDIDQAGQEATETLARTVLDMGLAESAVFDLRNRISSRNMGEAALVYKMLDGVLMVAPPDEGKMVPFRDWWKGKIVAKDDKQKTAVVKDYNELLISQKKTIGRRI